LCEGQILTDACFFLEVLLIERLCEVFLIQSHTCELGEKYVSDGLHRTD